MLTDTAMFVIPFSLDFVKDGCSPLEGEKQALTEDNFSLIEIVKVTMREQECEEE